ncbi:MAG TPA: MBL fold metallo-hydrolase [Gaiellaceae bacterium]|nr:MBL fold metallo-hydrolase [Gaiellaceae bacterium]
MRLNVVGCSPAWPNPGGAQSGYLVEGEGRLLLDCGPGVLARLREGDGGWPKVDAILITHFHLDHWGDIVPWVWGRMYGLGRDLEPPELWLHPGGMELVAEIGSRLGFPEMFAETFKLRTYEEGRPFEAAGFAVTAFRVLHYRMEAYAFRVEGEGRSLAYSGDTAPCPALAEAARDADLFLCEATIGPSNPDPDELRGHLSEGEALAAFEASGAARLLLTHRPVEQPLDPSFELVHDGYATGV